MPRWRVRIFQLKGYFLTSHFLMKKNGNLVRKNIFVCKQNIRNFLLLYFRTSAVTSAKLRGETSRSLYLNAAVFLQNSLLLPRTTNIWLYIPLILLLCFAFPHNGKQKKWRWEKLKNLQIIYLNARVLVAAVILYEQFCFATAHRWSAVPSTLFQVSRTRRDRITTTNTTTNTTSSATNIAIKDSANIPI